MLDQRLLACADYVRPGKKVIDVGTDHAKLPCHLLLSGRTAQAIAADVNENPLLMAKKTIEENGLTEKIRTVLSDGLAQLTAVDGDDIVIAGMGGELIARLVLDCTWLRDGEKHLILQPMTNAPYLRRTLAENGFEILSETPVFENGHHYSILLCAFTGVCVQTDGVFTLIGKIAELKTPQGAAYRAHQRGRLLKIAEGLERSETQADQAASYRELAAKIPE